MSRHRPNLYAGPVEMDTRVGCYGWIELDGKVLLTYWTMPDNEYGARGEGWTLPGGGMEVGESTEQTVVRELAEETGYVVEVGRLLGTDSFYRPPSQRYDRGQRYLHSLRVVYLARIVGGEFAVEEEGSTTDAGWFTPTEIARLDRVSLVDAGLRMAGKTEVA